MSLFDGTDPGLDCWDSLLDPTASFDFDAFLGDNVGALFPEPIVIKSGPSSPEVTFVPLLGAAQAERSEDIGIGDSAFSDRCNATNRRSGRTCNNKASFLFPDFLPTCRVHRRQGLRAGRCIYRGGEGQQCSRLFHWHPPELQYCPWHRARPDCPPHILKLPTECRVEIFRYLLPQKPIDSGPPDPPTVRSGFHNLFYVNKQFYAEAKRLLYGTVPFTIDVRQEGIFMCGRVMYEPRTEEGALANYCRPTISNHINKAFERDFDFDSVRNYVVDVAIENGIRLAQVGPTWDEEVELYTFRDYMRFVLRRILRRPSHLNRLEVRFQPIGFQWSPQEAVENLQLVIEPLMNLRNVRRTDLSIFSVNFFSNTISVAYGPDYSKLRYSLPFIIASNRTPLYEEELCDFKKTWQACLSRSDAAPPESPMYGMFSKLKELYTDLSAVLPSCKRSGRDSFLHRARVARESLDLAAFHSVQGELFEMWFQYQDEMDATKNRITQRFCALRDADPYVEPATPSHKRMRRSQSAGGPPLSNSAANPIVLDEEDMMLPSNESSRPRSVWGVSPRDQLPGSPQPGPSNYSQSSGYILAPRLPAHMQSQLHIQAQLRAQQQAQQQQAQQQQAQQQQAQQQQYLMQRSQAQQLQLQAPYPPITWAQPEPNQMMRKQAMQLGRTSSICDPPESASQYPPTECGQQNGAEPQSSHAGVPSLISPQPPSSSPGFTRMNVTEHGGRGGSDGGYGDVTINGGRDDDERSHGSDSGIVEDIAVGDADQPSVHFMDKGKGRADLIEID